VVTDGADTVSSVGTQDLLRRLRQSGTIVYAIGVLGDEDRGGRRAAKRALNAITKASGGQAFYAQDVSEVEGFAKRIAAEIRSQYVLGYTPVDLALDGKYRRVRVTLSDDQQAVVRTRDGYFAVPFGRKPRSMNASPVILLPGPGGGSR
jgi:VWFA-related protein